MGDNKISELGRRLEDALKELKKSAKAELSQQAQKDSQQERGFERQLDGYAIEESLTFDTGPLNLREQYYQEKEALRKKYQEKMLSAKPPKLSLEERVKVYVQNTKSKDVTAQQAADDLQTTSRKARSLLLATGFYQEIKEPGKKTRYLRKPSSLEVYTKKDAQEGIYIKQQTKRVFINGKPSSSFSPNTIAFGVLSVLYEQQNQPVSTEEISNRISQKTAKAPEKIRQLIFYIRDRLKKEGATKEYIEFIRGKGYALYPQGKIENENPAPASSSLEEMLTPTEPAKKQRRFKTGETKRILSQYQSELPADTTRTPQELYDELKNSFGDQSPPPIQVLGRMLVYDIGGWERIKEGKKTTYIKKGEGNPDKNPASQDYQNPQNQSS